MRLRSLAFTFLVGLSLGSAASAQACFVDDGMMGPCCAPVLPSFPVFPVMTLGGKAASINDCVPQCVWNTTNTIIPIQVLCDYWLFNVTVTGGPTDPSIPIMTLLGKYARTWMEFSPTGPVQVWRWLVNTDATYALPASTPPNLCQIPFSALPPYNLPVHLQGHLDYALDCATNTWSVAYALTHLCPFESHAWFSARPLALPAGLPARTYHFVAPGNFVFGTCPAPAGPIVGDAQRTTQIFPTYQCLAEKPIVQGNLATVFQDCFCSIPGGPIPPTNYTHQNLNAFSASCGFLQPIASVPVPGILPTGFRHLAIGSWVPVTTAPVYPGPECIGFYTGVINYADPCPLPGAPIFHIVGGVGTVGGWPAASFTSTAGLVTTQAVDIGNMLLFPSLTAGIGALYATDRIWSFDMP